VADDGGGRHLQHQRGKGKVRGKPVQWRRTRRHDSLRGGDDSGGFRWWGGHEVARGLRGRRQRTSGKGVHASEGKSMVALGGFLSKQSGEQ
jgi:hypothetical protein